jgi:hypothetical protein
MDSNAEMYKKKYLKYKMKYLSLQRGGLFGNLFASTKISDSDINYLCKIENGVIDECNKSSKKYDFTSDLVIPKGLTREEALKKRKDEMLNSKLKIKYDNGDIYEGNWKDGKPWGQGTMKYANRDIYIGNWENGKPWGEGTMNYANRDIYIGNWENGKRHGKGKMTYTNNIKINKNWFWYDGNWKDDKQNGDGVRRSFNGTYKGRFVDNKRDTYLPGLKMYLPSSFTPAFSNEGPTYYGGWDNDKKAQW